MPTCFREGIGMRVANSGLSDASTTNSYRTKSTPDLSSSAHFRVPCFFAWKQRRPQRLSRGGLSLERESRQMTPRAGSGRPGTNPSLRHFSSVRTARSICAVDWRSTAPEAGTQPPTNADKATCWSAMTASRSALFSRAPCLTVMRSRTRLESLQRANPSQNGRVQLPKIHEGEENPGVVPIIRPLRVLLLSKLLTTGAAYHSAAGAQVGSPSLAADCQAAASTARRSGWPRVK